MGGWSQQLLMEKKYLYNLLKIHISISVKMFRYADDSIELKKFMILSKILIEDLHLLRILEDDPKRCDSADKPSPARVSKALAQEKSMQKNKYIYSQGLFKKICIKIVIYTRLQKIEYYINILYQNIF